MIECSIQSLTKFYGAEKIFENISFDLQDKERVGLIGQNGCGKTTLLKILTGEEEYQAGVISFRKGLKVGYLDQIFKCDPLTTVIELLESAFDNIKELANGLKTQEEKLKTTMGDSLQAEMDKYATLQEEFERQGGYLVQTNINKITSGLKIPHHFRTQAFMKLSGGEKTRVMLARVLLEEPDLLLLDEPTNHLDISSIEWLEEFLLQYKGTVLMVSHDRHFLDKVSTRIIELEPSKANLYDGNYSQYVVEKEKRFQIAYREYLNNQRKIDQMERQIERYRIWGAMRDSEKMYVRAKELEKRLDKMEVIDKPKEDSDKIKLKTSGIERSGKIVLDIEELGKSFGQKVLFSNLSFTLFYKDRLCIMGENGSGKSTLLRLILGELKWDKGKIKLGSNLNIGYLPQNVVFQDEELSILDHFAAKHKLSNSEARKQLAKMLFIQDDVFKRIKSLSGGEKSRLRLASLIFDKVNLMILDEPTNHLDIDSREVLEDTLTEYEGTILFVSHDRYFVEKLANKMLVFTEDGVKYYPFNYNDYLQIKAKEDELLEEKKEYTRESLAPKRHKETVKKPNPYKLAKINEKISSLESRLDLVSNEMNVNSDNAEKLYELYQEKENLEEELLMAYEELEEVQG